MSDLNELYQQVILDHYKRPRNFHKLPDANRTAAGNNPLCGDEVNVQLSIENNIIKDVKYNGSACMVSIVSSSLISDFIKGKTINEVQKISQDDVLNIIGINLTTSRIKCATLVLDALLEAVKNYNS